jgi:hypothetical protein
MSHDSRGALLKKGDRVLIEGVLVDNPQPDNGYCNCRVKIITPEQRDKPPMDGDTLSAINTRMLTKIRSGHSAGTEPLPGSCRSKAKAGGPGRQGRSRSSRDLAPRTAGRGQWGRTARGRRADVHHGHGAAAAG